MIALIISSTVAHETIKASLGPRCYNPRDQYTSHRQHKQKEKGKGCHGLGLFRDYFI